MFVICIRFLTNYVPYIVVNSNRFYLPYFIQSKYWWIFNISIPFSTRTVNGTLSACQSSPLVLSLHWTFLILEVNGIRVVNLCAVWKGLIVCSVCIDFYLKLTIHLILFRTIKKKTIVAPSTTGVCDFKSMFQFVFKFLFHELYFFKPYVFIIVSIFFHKQ